MVNGIVSATGSSTVASLILDMERTLKLRSIIEFLAHTSASDVIRTEYWIIPTVQIVHILAISVVMASMAMFDLRLMGLAATRNSIASFSKRFMPWLWIALVVLLLSGSILIIGEPERSLGNIFFQIKMGLLLTAIIVTVGFQIRLKRDLAQGASDLKPAHFVAAKFTGLISLALWIGIVACGRFIAYSG